MIPHFHTDFSISDSLIFVRKSVLIYETIIKSVNLNTTEQIKDLAGRIELAFAVFDTTNNTFTNQQFIKRPMEFTILYSGIMISMMRMSLSLLTRKLLKQMTLYWKM